MAKKRKTIDWETIEREKPNLRCLHLGHGEKAVTRLLKNLLWVGKLSEAWDLSNVLWHEFEFPLPRGKADLVLFHADGTISVVEAKDRLDTRQIVAGIGQLSMYAVQVGFSRSNTGIRKILTVPVEGKSDDALLIDQACRDAGVIFEPLGPIQEHEDVGIDLILSRYPQYEKK